MKDKVKSVKGFRRLKTRPLINNDQALIGIILGLIMMVVALFIIVTIIANIIPIVIFLVLAIVFALIMKHMLFGGRSLGVVRGVAGFTREVGREAVPVARQAGGALGHLIGR